ncbi:DDE-type integrase/transposase/recombinase [Bacillus thuringiensis]
MPGKKPNQVWVADITYVSTKEGWLYVASLMDLYFRKIMG